MFIRVALEWLMPDAPVKQPKEVKVIHNDDSVALHKKVYKLEQRIERLEKLLAEKEGK